MKAIKGNKSYFVDDNTKASFLADGFDIYEDDGALIQRAKPKMIDKKLFDKLAIENESLKSEIAKLKTKK